MKESTLHLRNMLGIAGWTFVIRVHIETNLGFPVQVQSTVYRFLYGDSLLYLLTIVQTDYYFLTFCNKIWYFLHWLPYYLLPLKSHRGSLFSIFHTTIGLRRCASPGIPPLFLPLTTGAGMSSILCWHSCSGCSITHTISHSDRAWAAH